MKVTQASLRGIGAAFSQWGIEGPMIIEPAVFTDERGCFLETYQRAAYTAAGIAEEFNQDNYSRSVLNVIRGLHIQRGQSKIVRCISGAIFDVVVDLRHGSLTEGRWHSEILTGDNRRQLYVPSGFAHGFLAMSATAEVEYKCSTIYNPSAEFSVAWNDPTIGIRWPLAGAEPILSARDKAALTLREHEGGALFLF